MKRLLILIMLLIPSFLWAAGTTTVGTVPTDDMLKAKVVTISYVGDSGDGSVPNATIPFAYLANYFLYKVEMIPGGTAPDEYDVYVLNSSGTDLLGGEGVAAGHASNKTQVSCAIGSTYAPNPLDGKNLTVQIANQATVSATWTVNLYFVK